MSKENPAHPSSAPDLRPEAQRDENDGGAIRKPQQTDATMRERDLARGSEPETRGTSGRR